MKKYSEYCSESFQRIFDIYGTTLNNTRTFDEYKGYVNLLCNYLEKDFLEISYFDAQKYMNHMLNKYHEGALSRKTICVRLSCYKSTANYIVESGEYPSYVNAFERIRRPDKSDDSINPKRVPSLQELDKIMTQAKSDDMYYLILALATRVGLSVSNILSIKITSLKKEGERYFLYFPSKSDFKPDRYVCLPDDVASLLIDFIDNSEPDEMGHIFFNAHHNPLRIRNVDAAVESIVKASGITEHYTMKDLRTRAILEMVNAGAEVEEVKEYTGLSSLRLEAFASARNLIEKTCPANLVNYQLKVKDA